MRLSFTRWVKEFCLVALTLLAFSALVLLGARSADASSLANSLHKAKVQPAAAFIFTMVPASSDIKACLPNAKATVTITVGPLNDTLQLSVSGLAHNAGFALFVIQLPAKPFGISWYQSDMKTDLNGSGSVTARGIFNRETFSLSPGGPTTTFAPTHQYHLGLWFADPQVPFNLGCEPGAPSPIITPFDGDQVAGIQVLNTSNYPKNAGPLSHVA